MLPRRELRWAGAGISNGRLRLTNIPSSSRHYTVHTSSRCTLRLIRPSIARKNPYLTQLRSLSIFGWGGSSKTPSTDGTILPSNAQNIEVGPSSLSNIRTIKASHATSDAPDPSVAPNPTDGITVPVLDKLTDAVAFPADSEKFTALLEDSTPIATTPEYIGYLRETCGLDFGWGPSSTMQFLFEHIHISGALTWTASIIALSTILRLTMIPAMVLAQKESQKMKEIAPYVAPLREKYQALIAEGNRVKAMEVGTEMRALNKAANIKYSRMLGPILIQFPFQFGAFRMLRASADLPVPAYVDQSWLWNADLSLSDPYYLAPAVSAGLIYLQFQQSQKQQNLSPSSPVTPNMLKVMGRVIPAASFLFMFWQPGAVQLYFMISSIWAFSTTWALRQTPIRAVFNLSPMDATSTVSSSASKEVPKSGLQSKSRFSMDETKKEAATQPAPDRSMIDKGVDRLKSMVGQSGTGNKGAIATRVQNSVDTKQKKLQKERAVKYEQDQKRKLKIMREERNRELKNSQA